MSLNLIHFLKTAFYVKIALHRKIIVILIFLSLSLSFLYGYTILLYKITFLIEEPATGYTASQVADTSPIGQ